MILSCIRACSALRYSACSSGAEGFQLDFVQVAKLSWLPGVVMDLSCRLGSNFITEDFYNILYLVDQDCAFRRRQLFTPNSVNALQVVHNLDQDLGPRCSGMLVFQISLIAAMRVSLSKRLPAMSKSSMYTPKYPRTYSHVK